MAKFIIECPHCGTYQTASTSFFARNVLECKCGNLIEVNKDRYTIRQCPHCGNSVMYDQSKGDKAICPICKEKLVTEDSKIAIAHIHCPSCACDIQVDKNATTYECPLCKTKVDVQEQIKKEQIISNGRATVIKYEGENDVLVWKHPIEDFNLGSQLIVHESQEAIFYRDGQALDLFGAGRYTLATQKLPLLEKLYKLPTNGTEVFHSEVYFINLVTQAGIKWGTDTKVRMFDPASGLSVEIGACGEFTLRVSNSRKLLLKIVGTTSVLKNEDLLSSSPFSVKTLTGKFKGLIVSKVKTILAKVIREHSINILEVDLYLEVIAQNLKEEVNKVLDDYGLTIPEFYVSSILTPDNDPNFKRMKEQYAEQYLLVRDEQIKKNIALAEQQRRIVEAQTGAQVDIIQAQAQAEAYKLQAEAEAKEMQMKGYTYQQETQRQIGVAAMQNAGNVGNGTTNGGVSSIVADMANLGIGLSVAGQVVSSIKENVTPLITPNAVAQSNNVMGWDCACGTKNITSMFCPNCGSKKKNIKTEWDCTCGTKNITSMFCPNCGQRKVEEKITWICPNCGKTDIESKFCPECGTKKEE